jgi:hypothetical protein
MGAITKHFKSGEAENMLIEEPTEKDSIVW